MNSHVARYAFGLLLAATSAGAQVVYKSTMPDGKVLYGAKPEPGARQVHKIEPPPAKTGTVLITPEEQARVETLAKDRAAAAAVRQDEVEDARKQLQKAQAARDAGKDPLPGERTGTVSGKGRLADAYETRQKALEDAVSTARKRLDEALRGK